MESEGVVSQANHVGKREVLVRNPNEERVRAGHSLQSNIVASPPARSFQPAIWIIHGAPLSLSMEKLRLSGRGDVWQRDSAVLARRVFCPGIAACNRDERLPFHSL